jgi:hypothetical protein
MMSLAFVEFFRTYDYFLSRIMADEKNSMIAIGFLTRLVHLSGGVGDGIRQLLNCDALGWQVGIPFYGSRRSVSIEFTA